ncbi:MAG: threonine/serine dehydratase [Chloroflexi bacterium]|nr:threonine/serine dehydratase [Chloroflexota bacterium]
MRHPTFQDVLQARKNIGTYLRPTPLITYPALNELLEAQAYVKREDCQPIGAFKLRGGINFVSQLSPEERRRGIITASTGNHGQSIAYACRLFGVRAVIAVPEGSNPLKLAAMRRLGAEVREVGRVFDDAREYVERQAREAGYRYVHPANEASLIAGVATETLETLEEVPDLDVVFLPVGGGSGAAGACIVAKAVNPAIRVVAVQSAQAPAAYLSWKARRLVEAPVETFAEGLATRSGYQLSQEILWDLLDDFVLVSDDDLRQAMVAYLERCHTLAEAAGAAPLAGALKLKDQVKGKRVALVLSGANITLEQLRAVLDSTQGPGAVR